MRAAGFLDARRSAAGGEELRLHALSERLSERVEAALLRQSHADSG